MVWVIVRVYGHGRALDCLYIPLDYSWMLFLDTAHFPSLFTFMFLDYLVSVKCRLFDSRVLFLYLFSKVHSLLLVFCVLTVNKLWFTKFTLTAIRMKYFMMDENKRREKTMHHGTLLKILSQNVYINVHTWVCVALHTTQLHWLVGPVLTVLDVVTHPVAVYTLSVITRELQRPFTFSSCKKTQQTP